ncbi:cell envelope integrity protein CreD [Sphingomonas sp. AR_OL41]|uniref:cell envelope integrity protein CreD n=1 Tax=Sphingomonas sp. AR_OL41 TaxID=3042729 RepID=UPI0024811FB9|nr:cell envelope integrity protein CreD [Sphingomonas sp. AR_OL41]MDH7975104.1 cell envelope integrity protein CreD [Sphingomonas sp. AR_OL41]
MSDINDEVRPERSPGQKLLFAILVGVLLAVPLFAIYLLVYDRSHQSTQAREAIAQGWGGAQVISGPVLVIPYTQTSTETVVENGKQIEKTSTTAHELMLQAQTAELRSALSPKQRHYSIYDAVVYEARNVGTSRFALPDDLDRLGIDRATLALDKAELRFGIEDARGLFGAPPTVKLAGQKLPLKPGHGPRETGGSGFYSFLDAGALRQGVLEFHYDYSLRGNESLTLLPSGGDTRWVVDSAWPSPSFQGKFLPEKSDVAKTGFSAQWRVGNLALGKSLASIDDDSRQPGEVGTDAGASVNLVTPVDLYDQVNRSVKYGFLFIGFTFTAFLMFDVIGGVRVSPIEYLLVGAGLILFFVMLLAFAEVIGFSPAYVVAAAAIIGLLTAYSAAVLGSWRRGCYIAGLLSGLYGALFVLLSLEAYSLMIGSLLLFVALAAVMYLTRGLDWGARRLVA